MYNNNVFKIKGDYYEHVTTRRAHTYITENKNLITNKLEMYFYLGRGEYHIKPTSLHFFFNLIVRDPSNIGEDESHPHLQTQSL